VKKFIFQVQQTKFTITWLKCMAMVLQDGEHKFDKYILITVQIIFKLLNSQCCKYSKKEFMQSNLQTESDAMMMMPQVA
jgi:hypothetical protein